jgi:hypothetical protein
MKKSLIGILMATVILVSSIIPLLAQGVYTSTANGLTVDGVLKTDAYVMYPFEKENLYLGISKYGELINGEAKQGLEYGIMDAFANPAVAEADWSQGWFIDIHYADADNRFCNVWAFAMYTDLSGSGGIGGDWKEACANGPLGAPHGGRKTNAWATTAPLQVLYDGPRRMIVQASTVIYSAATKTVDDALVGITLTFVFNKDKKCVVVYKDIKRLDLGKFSRTFQVEFSNRGEWDLGNVSAPPSYAYFYDNLATAYTEDYHDFYSAVNPITGFDVAQMISKNGAYVGFAAFWPQLFGKLVDGTSHITRDEVLRTLCTQVFNVTWGTGITKINTTSFAFSAQAGWPTADSYPRGDGVWSDEPMVFLNGILLSGNGVDYSWNGAADELQFKIAPSGGDKLSIVYKHQTPDEGVADNMQNHVAEPKTPYVIGEWVFDLEDADRKREFRAVSVYGLMARHDADDADVLAEDTWSPAGAINVLDSEVQYYLNETFNPWDLKDAVHKETRSWVEWYSVPSFFGGTYTTLRRPVIYESDYDAYSAFSERVMASGKLLTRNVDYTFSVNPTTGYGSFTFGAAMGGTTVKIIYHTKPDVTSSLDTGLTTVTTQTGTVNTTTVAVPAYSVTASWSDKIGAGYKYGVDFAGFTVTADPSLNTTGNWTSTWTLTSAGTWVETDFKVFLGETYKSKLPINNYTDAALTIGEAQSAANFTFGVTQVAKNVTATSDTSVIWPLNDETTHILSMNLAYNVEVTVQNMNLTDGAGTSNNTVSVTFKVRLTGSTHSKLMGRSEWTVVGLNAASVDSAGAALVTAAFKNKQVEIGMAGADMYDSLIYNQMPWVMSKWSGTGTGWAPYYKSETDLRTALRDDWCHAGTTPNDEWPIAGSNMIAVGGPLANVLAYYANDFTDAIYGIDAFTTGSPYNQKIAPVSCWNRGWDGTWNVYNSSETTGYAVVSTYRDINGTNILVIYGNWGRDTFYATRWFHEHLVYQLQEAPDGVTSLVVKINYESTGEGYKPTGYSIVEVLGTISEQLWVHDGMYKGGIHDP